MLNRRMIKAIDKPFILVLAAILLFGLIILTSASTNLTADPYFYLKRQVGWIFVGLGLIILILRNDFIWFSHHYDKAIYASAIIILVIVLLFGKNIRGHQGWIGVGGITFQVAEFVKILIILSFANFLNARQGMLNSLKDLLPCFVYTGIPILLILKQPDIGTALVFIAITFGMMFIAGANSKILLWIIVGVLTISFLALYLHQHYGMWLPMANYQINRLTVFMNPYNDGAGGRGPGWNTIQSLIATGSGGIWGQGLFGGSQVQLDFLPEHHTDFIFAVLGEELGLAGALSLILLYAVFMMRAIHIADQANDNYSSLVVIGLISMWLFHIFESIGMVIGIMPITGIPLPFFSYGGSSMLTNMIGVGILLNINIKNKIVF